MEINVNQVIKYPYGWCRLKIIMELSIHKEYVGYRQQKN